MKPAAILNLARSLSNWAPAALLQTKPAAAEGATFAA
jgi:hypothetical protein